MIYRQKVRFRLFMILNARHIEESVTSLQRVHGPGLHVCRRSIVSDPLGVRRTEGLRSRSSLSDRVPNEVGGRVWCVNIGLH